ncbi:unnamed protein product [Urochloa humidicola]
MIAKLCLDGVPRHAWSAELAERIISRTCALEGIETNIQMPAATKTIDLWAWTANPSTIPKLVWLTFTGRARDHQLAAVQVSETPPERWQRGIKHPVIVHLEEFQDYTTASVNLDDRTSCTPTTRKLPPWRLGVIDGETAPRHALERAGRHQSPLHAGERGHNAGHDEEQRRRDDDGRDRPRRTYNNDHHKRWNVWRRKDDDDNDDRDGRGRDHSSRRRDDGRKGSERVVRERERSPKRRFGGGSSSHGGRRHEAASPALNTTLPQQLPKLIDLRSKEVIELQFLFAQQASTIQEAARNFLNGNRVPGVPDTQALNGLFTDYIAKTTVLADKLQLHVAEDEGTEAWSGSASTEMRSAGPGPWVVPVPQAFQRILDDLPQASPTMGEVDAALHQLQLNGNLDNDAAFQRPCSPTLGTPGPLDESFVDWFQQARLPVEQLTGSGTADTQANMFSFGEGTPAAGGSVPPSTPATGGKAASSGSAAAPGPELMNNVRPLTAASEELHLEGITNPSGTELLDCLFVNPASPLLHHDDAQHGGINAQTPPVPTPPAKRQRRRRVFDMSTVRRSVRLSTARPMTAMQRAQRNLCRKLGLLNDEMLPIEIALQEFLAMFQGPLPHYIIAALTAAFNLEDDGVEELNEALAAVAGDAIEDLQDEANNIQLQAQAAAP